MTPVPVPAEPAGAPGVPGVVVAIPTYRRPESLARLVRAVLAQATEVDADVRVLVIDNDPGGSARDVVHAVAGSALGYRHEPRPGLAAVRNRALDESADADALVFIDDDETPAAGWLAALLDVWTTRRCDAVAGPAVKQLPDDVDGWVRGSGHFADRRRPSGTVVAGAATNNLLLDRRAVDRFGVRFDERFGLSGGEDTLFTRTLVRRGGTVVWCDEAVVEDPVPADRATRRWVLRRSFRTGTTWSRVHVTLAGTRRARWRQRAELTARGAWSVLRGAAGAVRGAVTGSLPRRAGGERDLASGLGVLLGVAGLTFREYGRPTRR
ncbi:glycosyltransferase family 2 protein [uncultured Cellulomonas sp.]|uniref:glycosyltransferase family 2 protein n=1 Tax=uncultured Cellulomonas sp. TaxID=189682 RepID=UPI002624D7E2|nr:glycosyltransferase family 2 protein [uncultured Cellulomonas sp.]